MQMPLEQDQFNLDQMTDVPNHNVNNVTLNVLPVLMQLLVILVLESEKMHQIVIAHMDIILMKMVIVNYVPQLVKYVLISQFVVNVHQIPTEETQPIVHVLTDFMMMEPGYVKNVTLPV